MRHSSGLWTRWVAGLLAIVILIVGVSWLSSRFRGERDIHFWMDDATGIEPGTVVNLSGVRAGVVTRMALDADPAQDGAPRAKVHIGLTDEAFRLLNPREWVIAITTSPLPGFKAAMDMVRNEGDPLPELPDGAWHTDARSAVTKQINLAFDALVHKVNELTGGKPGDAFSLKNILPRPPGDGGEGDSTLISWVLNPEQVGLLTGVLHNVDALTGTAVKNLETGGLAHAALGAEGHANLLKLTEDLGKTVSRLRGDIEGQGNLLQVLLTKEDAKKISDVLNSIDALAGSALESQRIGGLAHTALGSTGHANLLRLTEDAASIAKRVRTDLEDDGTLLQLLFTSEDSGKISDLIGNLDLLSKRIAALDLSRIESSMDSLENVRTAMNHAASMVTRLIAPRADGRPSELEEELAELPQHIKRVYESVDKATVSTEAIMDQTAEVLRKANLTVSSINQLLMSLKRSWLFRGAFNESLRYEDLAPFLVPPDSPQGGERFEHEELIKSLNGDD